MSFSTRFGSILGQNCVSKGHVPMSSMLNTIRCMSASVFIGGLPYDMDNQSLRKLCNNFGDVHRARILVRAEYKDLKKSIACGLVKFTRRKSADYAVLAMDGQKLDGRKLHVKHLLEPM